MNVQCVAHSMNIGHFCCNPLYITQIQGCKFGLLLKVGPEVFMSLLEDPTSIFVSSWPTVAHQLILVIALSRE